MDDDTADLIAQLCTRAGMIMEDASPLALTIASTDTDLGTVLRQLGRAVEQMERLISAATALNG